MIGDAKRVVSRETVATYVLESFGSWRDNYPISGIIL